MEEYENEYFRFELADPAAPGFCTSTKSYFGSLSEIGEAMECMEWEECCGDTVAAFKRYLDGELEAEHFVCYIKTRLLHPVRVIRVEFWDIHDAQWDHCNTWGSIYRMQAPEISLEQVVFQDGERYYRCIRPTFIRLQYASEGQDDWENVGNRFWGNAGVVTGDYYECVFTLFVEEECSDNLEEILSNMKTKEKLDFSKACDEIFGNG